MSDAEPSQLIDNKVDILLILDFGSQTTQLIARRLRDLGFYSEILPYHTPLAKIRALAPKGLIFSGGPESVLSAAAPRLDPDIYALNLPILGICYGMQSLAQQQGGQVQSSGRREFGEATVQLTADAPQWLQQLGENLSVWMSHNDRVEVLPPDFAILGQSGHSPIAIMGHRQKPWYGVQFHPESQHTVQGQDFLRAFAEQVCGCRAHWQLSTITAQLIEDIQKKVGSDQVLLALSGGVDSAVTAALLQRAIGEQLTCVFVDHGLLRQGERQQVIETFEKTFGIHLITVDATEVFFQALAGITDPEVKRKRIGQAFIEVFQETAGQLKSIQWLAQGTIYPDVIESAGDGSGSKVIKSHHNVGGLPEKLGFQLVEPLRRLFKDEVRRLGLSLGLPEDLIYRHPFPGPGLAVRILGEVTLEKVALLQAADAIFLEELKAFALYRQTSQAFAVLLPVESVAVIGDARAYAPVIALRAVETDDFMSARASALPFALLEKVSQRIINEISGLSRVVYDITSKPPATIEWE